MNCPCTPIAQSFQTPAAHNSLTTHPWDKATECQEQTARPHGKDLDLERRLSLHRALVALLPRRVPFAFPRRQIFFALGRRRSQLCLLPSTKNKRPNRQRLHYLPLFRLTHTAHRRTHPQCAPPTPTPTPAPTPARTPTPFLNSRQAAAASPRSSTQQHAHRGPAHTLVPSGAAPHTPPPRAAQPHVRQRYTALVQCAVFFCPSSVTLHPVAELRPRQHSWQTPLRSWLQRVSAPRPVRKMRQLPAAAQSGRLHCPSTSPALDSAPNRCKKNMHMRKFWRITSQNC